MYKIFDRQLSTYTRGKCKVKTSKVYTNGEGEEIYVIHAGQVE